MSRKGERAVPLELSPVGSQPNEGGDLQRKSEKLDGPEKATTGSGHPQKEDRVLERSQSWLSQNPENWT